MTDVHPSSSGSLDPRIRLSALWTSVMFLVTFVDIFAFYRADLRAQIEAGQVFVFTIDDAFLLGIVLYVAVPSLMVAASVLLPHGINRIAQIVIALLFAVTIIGAAVGERAYYLVASGFELALLAGIVAIAVRWSGGTAYGARAAGVSNAGRRVGG